MTTNQKIYIPLFALLILLQLYLPSFKSNIFIQIVALLFCVLLGGISFSRKYLDQMFPFAVLLVMGFIGTVLYRYKAYNIIKDIVHFIKPVTGLLLGYIICKKINNFKLFVKSIVIIAVLSAVIHFYIIFFLVKMQSSIDDLREYTKDNFLELFAMFFLIYYKKFQGTSLLSKPFYTNSIIALLAISNILYFSRTMIIMAAILLATVYGITKITSQTLKILAFFVVGLGLLYAYLFSVTITRGKPGLEAFLYKIKIAPEEIFKTRINRENHRDLWDHWRGYEAKRAFALMKEQPDSFIYGTGHGSLVNLKFFAPLTGEPKGMRYISELHNGYMYIFYKTGITGILIYLFIMLRWYCYIYKSRSFIRIIISAIGLIYCFSTLTITGLYNGRDIIVFILGGFLFSEFAQKYARQDINLNLQQPINEQ